nr:zinc-dependent metalloprotease [Niabella hibiscisoli]
MGIAANRYTEAVRQAIDKFNTLVPNTTIKMREVFSQASCDITVHLAAFNTGRSGYAHYPLNGNPGSDVYLDLTDEGDYSTIPLATLLAAHELGHAIGLFHTDEIPNSSFTESYGYYSAGIFYLKRIPGTPDFATASNPTPDLNSFIIKNINIASGGWSQSLTNPSGVGFSNDDIAAIQFLYPFLK